MTPRFLVWAAVCLVVLVSLNQQLREFREEHPVRVEDVFSSELPGKHPGGRVPQEWTLPVRM